MSAITTSSFKASKKNQHFMGTSSQASVSSQIRSSIIPSTTFGKSPVVSHITDKNSSILASQSLYVQKQLNNNNQSKKRGDFKPNNNTDYYTIQNTRNIASMQNTQQQTSRNQVQLQPNNNNSQSATNDQEGANTQNQNMSMRSPKRADQNVLPLDKIVENVHNTSTDFGKAYSQSQVKSSTIGPGGASNTNTSRHSILTNEKYQPRALSAVKNSQILSHSNFSQMSNFSKSQNAKKLSQITQSTNKGSHIYNDKTSINNSKTIYQKSVIINQQQQQQNQQYQPMSQFSKEQYSPKPGTEFNKHTIFKSPQQVKKQNSTTSTNTNIIGNNLNTGPGIFVSNSNSPLPIHATQNQKINRINSHTETQKYPQSRMINSQKLNKQNSVNNSSSVIHQKLPNNLNPATTPSCLQIDLSLLSNKNEDEVVTQIGNTVTQNAQALFSLQHQNQSLQQSLSLTQSISKSSQRKKSSVSQTKKTPLQVSSQSPTLQSSNNDHQHLQQSIVNKSPKTYKVNSSLVGGVNNIQSRHSLINNTGTGATGAGFKKQESGPKITEPIFQSMKNSTQKMTGGKASKTQTIVKSSVPFEKKKQNSERINSQEEVDELKSNSVFEIKQIVVSQKISSQQKHTQSQIERQSIQLNLDSNSLQVKCQEDDNFSFNSQNINTISVKGIKNNIKHKSSQDLENDNEDKMLLISEEQSNLMSQKSSLLQVVSQNNLILEEKETKLMSRVGHQQQKININLDISETDTESQFLTIEIFLQKNDKILLDFEKKEIEQLTEDFVYFCGVSLQDRSTQYISMYGNPESEKEIQKSLDDEEGYYNVLLGDHLHYRYEVLKILGKGSFAQVVSCLDHKTGQKVAIKITRNTEIDHKFAGSESKLLNYLMKNDPNDSHNVVRLINEFYFRDHHCFVFELLCSDLFEHLKENGFIGFEVQKIRDYAIQILQALIFLEKHQIIHCDLKPENILLSDHQGEKLKLVDYGSGCFRQEQVYTYVQSRFYRAPEVILRIPYSEKVDIWSFGCILAELYTGEPLFPGNNEQEQLELIMEICGIPNEKVIDKSRKKEHYFDVDYSPFLIEDEQLGILRIPESRKLEDAVPCQDPLFLDFMQKCLELDPELRFSASEAMKHEWIQDNVMKRESTTSLAAVNRSLAISQQQLLQQNPHSQSQNQIQPPQIMNRRREEEQDGVKGNVYEESPVRPIKDKPKKSLTKHFNFQTVKVGGLGDNDSNMSTPHNEGGVSRGDESGNKMHEIDLNFQSILSKEKVNSEEEFNKPNTISMINKNSNSTKKDQADSDKPKGIKMIGKYEIVRADEDPRDTNSQTSGIASEANIPPVNQHEAINNENAINKITVTFYQKRQQGKSHQSSTSKKI